MKKKIAIVFGGCSSEYEVSLQSAYAVITQLDPARYDLVLLGITQQGSWYRFYGQPAQILQDTWREGPCVPALISPSREIRGLVEFKEQGVIFTTLDAVFPVMHGPNGEDGSIQGLLQLAGLPVVGCEMASAVCCMDKAIAHQLVALAGIAVPPSVTFETNTIAKATDKTNADTILGTGKINSTEMVALTAGLHYPLFVKPARAGSSFGISKVNTPLQLPEAIAYAQRYDHKVVIEEAIDGFEVGCAVLGRGEQLVTGEVDEIELTQGFFDYKEKYTLETSKIHLPARIPPALRQEIQEKAKKVYRVLGCQVFARVDFFLTTTGCVFFNEVNTIPGFTSHSRYPNMMQQAGVSFADLVNRLVEMAVGA